MHIVHFADEELEVGDCGEEYFSGKLSRPSQVWHGTSTHACHVLCFRSLI